MLRLHKNTSNSTEHFFGYTKIYFFIFLRQIHRPSYYILTYSIYVKIIKIRKTQIYYYYIEQEPKSSDEQTL